MYLADCAGFPAIKIAHVRYCARQRLLARVIPITKSEAVYMEIYNLTFINGGLIYTICH